MEHLDEFYFNERERLMAIIEAGCSAEVDLVRLNYRYAPPAYTEVK